ncbi:MAG TPA: hypothetical protein VGC65_05550 [Bacteroidia bacterium]|jgi:hypothetical protein
METNPELEMAIVTDYITIKSLDVYYSDKEMVSGFVKSVKPLPFEVILCKHMASIKQDPYHTIDFNKAKKITLLYFDGKTAEYK